MAVNLPSVYLMKSMAKAAIRRGRAANSTRSKNGLTGHLSDENEEVAFEQNLCVTTRAYLRRRSGGRQVYRCVFFAGKCTSRDNTPKPSPWFFGCAGRLSHRRI